MSRGLSHRCEFIKGDINHIGGFQAPLIENADKFFPRLSRLITFTVQCKILPAHFKTLFDRLTKDGAAFIEADRLGLVTSSQYFLAEKS